MHRGLPLLLLVALLVTACGGASVRSSKVGDSTPVTAPEPPAGATKVLTGSMESIDGKPVQLADYAGKVVLVVNTASHCGFTPQYKSLEAMYKRYADKGFVILGFPSNDFQQEFTDNGQIKAFCSTNYGVTFPLFSRTSVKGPYANPVFKTLAAEPDEIGAPPTWNFTKYLLDRTGLPVARWDSSTDPGTPEVTNTVEAVLAQKS
jgi:glutathione peroxidase